MTRRGIARIFAIVASSHNRNNAIVIQVAHRIVHGQRVLVGVYTQTQIRYRKYTTAVMVQHPVDACNYSLNVSIANTVQYPHSNDRCFFCYAKCGAGSRRCCVGSMPVTI